MKIALPHLELPILIKKVERELTHLGVFST